MNLTIIKNGSTVLDMDIIEPMSEEQDAIIDETSEKYGDEIITSMQIEFVGEIPLSSVSDVSDIEPSMIKKLTLSLK
jgi:hypothetical protein